MPNRRIITLWIGYVPASVIYQGPFLAYMHSSCRRQYSVIVFVWKSRFCRQFHWNWKLWLCDGLLALASGFYILDTNKIVFFMQRVHLHFLIYAYVYIYTHIYIDIYVYIYIWQYQLLGSLHRASQQFASPVGMLVNTCFSATIPHQESKHQSQACPFASLFRLLSAKCVNCVLPFTVVLFIVCAVKTEYLQGCEVMMCDS